MTASRKPFQATVGGAHQTLENHARRLESTGDAPGLAMAIRTMLAWREKVLVEKYGFKIAEPYSDAPAQPPGAET